MTSHFCKASADKVLHERQLSDAMRQAERAERDAAEKAADDKERNRKEHLFAQIQKEGRTCPHCGSPGIIVDDPKQPAGYANTFWTTPKIPRSWWVEFSCSQQPQIKCGLRWKIYPDLPDDAPENAPEGKV